MYLPFLTSTVWNGPVPMIGGLLAKLVLASLPGTFAQMCSGRIGIHRRSMLALGLLQVILTVKSSTASTLSMLLVKISYDVPLQPMNGLRLSASKVVPNVTMSLLPDAFGDGVSEASAAASPHTSPAVSRSTSRVIVTLMRRRRLRTGCADADLILPPRGA